MIAFAYYRLPYLHHAAVQHRLRLFLLDRILHHYR